MPTVNSLWRLSLSVWMCTLWTGVRMQSCTKINSCSCTYGDDQVVDLSPLSGSPKWQDVADASGTSSYSYSYNPCTGFTEGSCDNVAVCQVDPNGLEYGCGKQDTATFTNDPVSGNLMVTYTESDLIGSSTRTSIVTLLCIDSGPDTLKVLGETSPLSQIYEFELSSVHCCIGAPPSPGGTSGLSTGSIMVIVFFSALIIYFAVGFSIQRFARHSSGREMVPNYGLWSSLPGLIKDGALFVVRRGKPNGGYSNI